MTAPAVPVTPPPGTIALRAGLSDDSTPVGAELTIAGVHDQLTIPTFTAEHLLIARLATEADITYLVFNSDPSMSNQILGFTKHGSPVDVSGTNYSVWVSHQKLTFASDRDLTVR